MQEIKDVAQWLKTSWTSSLEAGTLELNGYDWNMGCRDKRQVLLRERPTCTVYYVRT